MDGGFFPASSLKPISNTPEDVGQFAQAIEGRFNNSDRPLFTTRLAPMLSGSLSSSPGLDCDRGGHGHGSSISPMPATPLAPMSINSLPSRHSTFNSIAGPSSSSSPPPAEFTVVTTTSLSGVIRTPNVLILDIRPHSSYASARLPQAISLSVPSTLLKRPAFNLQKLTTMLSSSSARSRFSSWNKASRILAYDADSVSLHDGSNLLGLLRKFRAEGFTGDIAWLQGGIQALWRDQRHLVEEGPISDDEEEVEAPRVLRARDLPMSAFQQSSTTSLHNRTQLSSSPSSAFFGSTALARASSVSSQHHSLTHSGHTPSARDRFIAANPFYDNIRQNIELSHGITDRIPLRLSPVTASRIRELPFAWLRDIASSAGRDEGTEALAMQFYRIELSEQRRMQGVMAHHSMQSGPAGDREQNKIISFPLKSTKEKATFPYSITAGVEKGTKNRYRNIWPFEHTRVRLISQQQDDYINASFVQPLGTRRRYIATQGPLPSTYTDFWTIVWEQNVHVLVMLTRQFEGGDTKCGRYWSSGQYGPFSLKLVSMSGAKEEEDPGGGSASKSAGVFFNDMPTVKGADGHSDLKEDEEHNHTIRRTFELTHTGYPEHKPRTITHLQYLGWPDMNVPESPKDLLHFVREVDEAVDRANEDFDNDDDSDETPHTSPALLHCSAGVGRTGAFIVIDAVLDGIRREIRKRAREKRAIKVDKEDHNDDSSESDIEDHVHTSDAMDIDANVNSQRMALATSPSTASSPLSREALKRLDAAPIAETVPVATIRIGGDNSAKQNIHVPMVLPSEPTTTSHKLPFDKESLMVPQMLMPSGRTFGTPRHGNKIPIARSILKADFTVADADSMFTSPSPNPAFAMDVEPSLPPSAKFASSSSSGEGSTSGGDRASSSSGPGSVSSGRSLLSMHLALGMVSSSDDAPGRTDRSDSDSFLPVKLMPRGRARSDSGSVDSGVSSGANNSSSSGQLLSLPRSKPMSALGATSMSHSQSDAFTTAPSSPISHAVAQQQRSKRSSAPRLSLLAPKPLHPLQTPMAEVVDNPFESIQSLPALPPRLKSEKHAPASSSRSNLSSSSSIPSSTDNSSSIMSSTPAETSETPLSTHTMSRSSTPGKESPHERSPFGSAFDYTSPRKLHVDDSPPPLSTLEEPIRQILEDMREQRMSLCQSLRQYVFVHNAIIVGALQIVDEESMCLKPGDVSESGGNVDPSTTSAGQLHATGKRGASPTELPKENKKGDVALAKRPSINRGKSMSSGESTGSS